MEVTRDEKIFINSIRSNVPNSDVSVKIIEGFLLVEVISPSFTIDRSPDNQKAVYEAIKNITGLNNGPYQIQKIFTFQDAQTACNTVGHLLTTPSGVERGLFTVRLDAANDAYVNIRDFDANVLQFSSHSRSSDIKPMMTLRSLPITAGGLSQFQINEQKHYVELEMLGQIYVVSNTKKESSFWTIKVNRFGYDLPVDGYF